MDRMERRGLTDSQDNRDFTTGNQTMRFVLWEEEAWMMTKHQPGNSLGIPG